VARRTLKIHANPEQFWRICEGIDEQISADTDLVFRVQKNHFTRNGVLRPAVLVALILRMVAQGDRRGYRHLIEEFWQEANEQGVDLGTEVPVSAAALCLARQRLHSEVFRDRLYKACSTLDGDRALRRDLLWKGRRVFAVDGTTHAVRRSAELQDHFGAADGSHDPQANVVALVDVISRVPYDAWIGPYASCERAALFHLLPRLNPGDVLLLDRGFPSHEVIDALIRLRIDFAVRVCAKNSFRQVQEFAESGESERTVLFEPKMQCDPENPSSIKVRLVRCERPGAEPFILMTSLPKSLASRDELDDLYHMRWSIEEKFKIPKGHSLHQRQFHSKRVDGVMQEILGLLLYMALSQIMRLVAAHGTKLPPADDSQKGALLATARMLVGLMLQVSRDPKAGELLQSVLSRIRRQVDPTRPNRSHPRRSYQPRLRWSSTGRVGGA